MNENIQERNEFTFKNFFDLIKRSGKRIVIYAAIAAIIGLCIAAIIAVSTMGKEEYRGVFEYAHSGIADGEDPNGAAIDYNRAKSPLIVNDALTNMGYSEADIAKLAPIVEGRLTVEPYISDEIAAQLTANPAFTYHPTRYSIVLNPTKSLGMSDAQYRDLVNEIMKSYVKYFKEYYGYFIKPVAISSDNRVAIATDYYDVIFSYNVEIEAMKTAVAALPDSYVGIANKLYEQVNVLASNVADLEAYILRHNVQKENVSYTLADTLTAKINECRINAAAYASQSEGLTAAIEKYQKMFDSVVVGGDGKITITSANVTEYNNLIAENKTAIKLRAVCEAKEATYLAKKEMLGSGVCTENDRKYVESKFAALQSAFDGVVDNLNTELENYSNQQVLRGGVKIVNNGYKNRRVSYRLSVVVFVVCVVLGVLIAVAVTAVKKKKDEANSTSEAVEPVKSVAEETVEQ